MESIDNMKFECLKDLLEDNTQITKIILAN